MKHIFRRGKPPLKTHTKGDQKPKPERKAVEKVITIERAMPLCLLCNQPLTTDNRHTMRLNRKNIIVHKTCPEIKP